MSVHLTSLAPASPRPEAETEEEPAPTQPLDVTAELDDDDDDDVDSPVDAEITDLTVDAEIDLSAFSSPTTAAPLPEELVAEEVIQPLSAAISLLSSYVKTLRFTDQQTTVSDFGTAYIRKFATYYHESKSILTLQSDPTKTPNSCKVSIPFTPLDVISESMACKAFVKELTAVTEKLQLSANEMYLKGKCLNNRARKQELVEIFAEAVPIFAEIILEETEISSLKAHDLVADLLLYHPHNALEHIDGLELASFIGTYKKVNKCGRPPVDGMAVYRHFFPEDNAFFDRVAAAQQQSAAEKNSPNATADTESETPLKSRRLTLGTPLNAEKPAGVPSQGRGRGKKKDLGPHFTTALEQLRQSKESNPAVLAAIAAFEAATEDDTFDDPPNLPEASTITPLTGSLQNSHSQLANTPNTSTSQGATSREQQPLQQSTTSAMRNPKPNTIRQPVNPYTGSPYFSRAAERAAELELDAMVLEAETKLRSARMSECFALTLTNSIRSRSNMLPLLPDDGSPPDFSAVPSPTGYGIKEPSCTGPSPTIQNTLPPKSVHFDNSYDKIKGAVSLLSDYIYHAFALPKARYIEQYLYNKKSRKMSKIANKARLSATAKSTVNELLKTSKQGSDIPKALEEHIRKQVAREAEASRKRIQSLSDQVEEERKKRAKLEKQQEKLKQQSKKQTGAKTQGASEKNTSGTNPSAPVSTPKSKVTFQATPKSMQTKGRGNGGRNREGRGNQGGRNHNSGRGRGPTPQAGDANNGQPHEGPNRSRGPSNYNARRKPHLKWQRSGK